MTGMEGLYPVLSFPICSTTGGEREPTFDKIVKNGALEMPTVWVLSRWILSRLLKNAGYDMIAFRRALLSFLKNEKYAAELEKPWSQVASRFSGSSPPVSPCHVSASKARGEGVSYMLLTAVHHGIAVIDKRIHSRITQELHGEHSQRPIRRSLLLDLCSRQRNGENRDC